MCVPQSIHLYSSYTQPTNTNPLWDILIFVKDTKRRCTLRCLQTDSLQATVVVDQAAEAPPTLEVD